MLEIHPWGAQADRPELPDRVTIDLDPGDDVPWEQVIDAALEVRSRLSDLGLQSFVKTTGGKGLHVVFPLTPKADWDTVKAFTQSIAERMAADRPDRYTANMAKRERGGRIYVDYLRNGMGATAVARLFDPRPPRRGRVDAARLGRARPRHPRQPLHRGKPAEAPGLPGRGSLGRNFILASGAARRREQIAETPSRQTSSGRGQGGTRQPARPKTSSGCCPMPSCRQRMR